MTYETVTALVIPADAPPFVQEVEPDLRTISGIVGGYLEPIAPSTLAYGAWHGYVNEEGKIEGLPLNVIATAFAHSIGWPRGDFLVGSLVLLGSDPEDSAEEGDVPEEVLEAAVIVGLIERTEVGEVRCPGSGKPVGSGSRCETCGLSFGFPHPANLVVGRPAPVHPEQEHDTCPEHGEQEVTRVTSTGGPDPYAANHLACGHRVACFGPGEDNVIIATRKAQPRRKARRA